MLRHKPTRFAAIRQERIAASPRWEAERFRNTNTTTRDEPGVPMPAISELLCSGERRVPLAPLLTLDPFESWRQPPQSGLRATWLGHSTVPLEIDGYRVLTDPVWARTSPSRFLWKGVMFQPPRCAE